MKLLSIDIETTGLNPYSCSVLEIGCVLFSIDVPLAKDGVVNERARRWRTWECLIEHSTVQGEPYALSMNKEILNEIATGKSRMPILSAGGAAVKLAGWLLSNGVSESCPVTVTGKNYDRFDRQFLLRLTGWKQYIEPLLERRVLDVGSLCFKPSDGRVGNLTNCLDSVGVRNSEVSHRALDDALQVATVVSRFFPE